MKLSKDKIRAIASFAIVFVVYTVIAFAIPFKKNGTFAVSYVFTILGFALLGYVFMLSFDKGKDAQSKFYGFPIANIGVIYIAVQIVLSYIAMAAASVLPAWIATVIFIVLLAAAALGVISKDATRDEIVRQDIKLKKDVSLMRELRSKTLAVANLCEGTAEEGATKALAEKFRFSDPVSSDALESIENELASEVDQLHLAAVEGDRGSISLLCKKIDVTLAERNRLCKVGK